MVSRETLLADTKSAENLIQDIFLNGNADDFTQRIHCFPKIDGDQFEREAGPEAFDRNGNRPQALIK